MIRYSLTCSADHAFDSWFASDAAYATLRAAGQVGCPVCGSVQVDKALMAPAVRPARKAATPPATAPAAAPTAAPPQPRLTDPVTDLDKALATLRAQVEANSDYVGLNFAAEARAIHDGTAPERAIYGEARPEEAKKLLEDGIPVAPLPFVPARKVN